MSFSSSPRSSFVPLDCSSRSPQALPSEASAPPSVSLAARAAPPYCDLSSSRMSAWASATRPVSPRRLMASFCVSENVGARAAETVESRDGVIERLAELNGGRAQVRPHAHREVEHRLGRLAEGIAADIAKREQQRLHLEDGLIPVGGHLLELRGHLDQLRSAVARGIAGGADARRHLGLRLFLARHRAEHRAQAPLHGTETEEPHSNLLQRRELIGDGADPPARRLERRTRLVAGLDAKGEIPIGHRLPARLGLKCAPCPLY